MKNLNKIKVCVFCNKLPVSKSKEHVIPRWLIKLTGKPGRPIYLPSMGKGTSSFRFSAFTFPACEKCNNQYSKFEERAEKVIIKMLDDKKLASEEIEHLMDWLDKVRIGMWLGSIMYSNPIGIDPRFGIETRIKKDRILVIAKTSAPSRKLNFSGFNDPLFHHLNSFFGMYINGMALFSLSTDALLNEEIPLPNYKILSMEKSGLTHAKPVSTMDQEIHLPNLGKKFKVLSQINYPEPMDRIFFSKHQLKYMREGLKSSKILITDEKLSIYPDKPSMDWKPQEYLFREKLESQQNKKFVAIRNWIADKTLNKKYNVELQNIYQKLLDANIIGDDY